MNDKPAFSNLFIPRRAAFFYLLGEKSGLAGHSDIKTTLRYYVSISQHDLDEAREVMAKALAE